MEDLYDYEKGFDGFMIRRHFLTSPGDYSCLECDDFGHSTNALISRTYLVFLPDEYFADGYPPEYIYFVRGFGKTYIRLINKEDIQNFKNSGKYVYELEMPIHYLNHYDSTYRILDKSITPKRNICIVILEGGFRGVCVYAATRHNVFMDG